MGEAPPAGIAVVGMAGRLPGAADLASFWRNLRDGVESISFFTREELAAEGVDQELLSHPSYIPARGVLTGIELCDTELFGFNPREAEVLDPQHRLFLECAWEALESAGHNPDAERSVVGVFAGSTANTYLANNLRTHPRLMADLGPQVYFGNDKDFVAPLAAYKLNLRGPAINVQTACSTSLVAVCLAAQALLDFQCDMALAGGVSIVLPHRAGYLHREGGIASHDGHCRAFDAAADGSVAGCGAGVVVLRRLADALAAGDHIRAVIKGMAINNDGSGKPGFTAPSLRAQAEVVATAHALAGISGEDVHYVEAHGTGTRMGDPIEVAALARAFRTRKRGFCALGSVKTNIGHLDAAAGVASLLKVVLALEHGQIPPTLHFRTANPEMRLDETPFFVDSALRDWPRNGGKRRAGVSSFGIGGTNAHLVVEEAPPLPASGDSRPWQLLVLSAQGAAALDAATDALARHLAAAPEQPLPDVAFTLQRGRRLLPHRRALVCSSREGALAALSTRDPRQLIEAVQEARERPVTFLLSGLGDHYPGMGLGLYRSEPAYREAVDRCAAILLPLLGTDLRDVLYPQGVKAEEPVAAASGSGLDLQAWLGRGQPAQPEAPAALDLTAFAQPALFVVDYALACVWMEWGLRPESVTGYSVGEYVAACLAGALSLPDALRLVAERARWIGELPEGAMLAVALSEEDARGCIGDELSIAAQNGPQLSVVAGPEPAVASLAVRLAQRGVACRRLPTTHAFHSSMMEPAADRIARLAESVELQAPRIGWLSNVTGAWMSKREACDPGYWRRHLLQAVRFGDGVRELWREPSRILLEVGPGQALSTLALQDPGRPRDATVARSLRCAHERQPDSAFLLANLGALWLAGAAVDWAGFSGREQRRRVELPTYPFQRRRFWIAPRPQAEPAAKAAARPPAAAGRTADPGDWFYIPAWRPAPWVNGARQGGPWLLLADGQGIGMALARRLRAAGEDVVTAVRSVGFAREAPDAYALPAGDGRSWDLLLAELKSGSRLPRAVVHLWSLDRAAAGSPEEGFWQAQEAGFASVLALAQAMGRLGLAAVRLEIVTAGVHEVALGEELRPEAATVLGPCRVLPQEYPGLRCRAIDVAVAELSASAPRLVEALYGEILRATVEPVVALRDGRRWTQAFDPLHLPAPELESTAPLRRGGVYLVTGGLGNVGLTLAERLARLGSTVVLTGRSGLPPEAEWDVWLASHPAADLVSRRIARLRPLAALDGRIEIHAADAADAPRMRAVVEAVLARHGALDGVFHAAGHVDAASFSTVRETAPADWRRHFQPKAIGLFALEEALAGVDPEFCFLFSSTSCVLGGLGFAAYSAANLFMDVFVRDRRRRSAIQWRCANWDTWMAPGQPSRTSALGATLAGLFMTPDEGFDAVRRVLSLRGAEQVVVSLGDLEQRLDLWVRNGTRPAAQPAEGSVLSRHPRPALATPFVAPRNDIESSLAALWTDLLGIDSVGVCDNFFQLGGHSLLGTQLMSRVREVFHVDLSVHSLFDEPTVAGLAVAVVAERAAQAGGGALAEALQELAGLSDDEVRRRLEEAPNA